MEDPAEPGAPDPAAEARRRHIIASDTRWRAIFATLAVLLPLALGLLFRRQELRLRALADHGRAGTAVVTDTSQYTDYRYEVGGQTYTWNVSREKAPYARGASFPIVYLPEDPSLSRPGAVYGPTELDADLDLTFQHRLLLGLFGFFAGASLLCHRQLRRLRRGDPLRTAPRIGPDGAGRLVALLILGAVLAANADPKAQAVMAAVFGATPLGVPVVVAVSAAEIVLFAPYFWVFPHLMRIVMESMRRGGSLSKAGIVLAVAQAGPEQARSRWLVIAGLVYFVALMAGWIALAASKGV
jgi:hypothetical protein